MLDLKNTFKSKIEENKLDEDMYLAFVDNYTTATDTIIKGINKRFVQYYFCTKGMLTFNFNNGNYKLMLNEGENLVLYNPQMELPLNLSINAESKVCIIVVSIKKMHQLFSENNIQAEFLSQDKPEKIYRQQKTSNLNKIVLNQIENHNIDTHFENLYLTGKIYELFALYFSISGEAERENCPFLDNKEDARKLKEAKEILLNNISNPPILKDLSEETGLSEYKLKEGFKQVYGTTVYGFVLDKKMEIARERLRLKSTKIKDISFDLGYENPSHFIAAFKKKYGVTPKQFAKQF